MLDIPSAGLSIDLRELLTAPILVETLDPGSDFELISRFADIGQIDRQHVSAVDVLYVPSGSFGLVLACNVIGEGLLRFLRRPCSSRTRNASCGDMSVAVLDDPDGLSDELSVPISRLSLV
ncbi:hypothetical protein LMTR13_07650 [Bradyrhizobium icense]|uniref:Uncharacterized protein n=1 Tax=Bradyrhizobium icense TaxID=1274631 RepID=A0A1B1UBD6_9BRAD|nr:hypothetical protein LMTR13_07650 [Bradyrhizobium icense]